MAIRPRSAVDTAAWAHISAGVARLRDHFKDHSIIGIERLHAKAIVIDEEIAYIGSANFYRYSLETSLELMVRGSAQQYGNLLEQLERILREGVSLDVEAVFGDKDTTGIAEEVADPIVREILRQNPKAWIVKKPKG